MPTLVGDARGADVVWILGKWLLPVALAACLALAGASTRSWAQGADAPAQEMPIFMQALAELQEAAAVIGYLYASPLFELSVAQYRQLNGLDGEADSPLGVFSHFKSGLASDRTTWFGVPNPDVLHSSAWLWLSDGPMVIHIPPMDEHWYSVQVADLFMNDVGYLSSRTIGNDGGYYLIADQHWSGALPWGVRDVVRVPTDTAWVLLRIAATQRNQHQIMARYQSRFRLMPLDRYLENPRRALDQPSKAQRGGAPPPKALAAMRGTLDYFRVVNQLLRRIDIPSTESGLMSVLDLAGFGPGRVFAPERYPEPLREAVARGARRGERIVRDMRFRPAVVDANGWGHAPSHLGIYGSDYLLRAIASFGAIGANIVEEAVYPHAYYDSTGILLNGRNDYQMRFHRGHYPPADAYWSIAAYDAESNFLMPNPIDRFSIGSKTDGLVYDDGSLVIHIASGEPEDPKLRANWLPVSHRPFYLVARIYSPLPEALDGSYAMPAIMRRQPSAEASSAPPF